MSFLGKDYFHLNLLKAKQSEIIQNKHSHEMKIDFSVDLDKWRLESNLITMSYSKIHYMHFFEVHFWLQSETLSMRVDKISPSW